MSANKGAILGATGNRTILWTTFFALGALLWLSSVGMWTYAAYRTGLIVAMLSWAGNFARVQRPS